jgi:hypothetical protein
MKLRLGLSLLALLGLSAFAPAPFPRSSRRGDQAELTLTAFQGRWRVTKWQGSRASGQHHLYLAQSITHVRVKGGRWEFLGSSDDVVSDYAISVLPQGTISHLDFHADDVHGTRVGSGLIRRQGAGIQVIYRWGADKERPAFEPPAEGGWILTMQREN